MAAEATARRGSPGAHRIDLGSVRRNADEVANGKEAGMATGSKLGLVTVALGAVIVSAGIAGAAGDRSPRATGSTASNLQQVTFAQLKEGTIAGMVGAGKVPRRQRARVYISVRGLPPIEGDSDRYLVTADRRPCSEAAGDENQDGVVDGADFLVFRVGIIMANTEGDFHVRAPLRSRLDEAKSIRLYDWPGPLVQKACGRTVG
jgi:hypothetical protein